MNPWIQVTGWTLIHFVWQGAILAFGTAVALRVYQRRSAEARYAIACFGLAAMCAAAAVTAAVVWTRVSAALPDAKMQTGSEASGVALVTIGSSADGRSGSTAAGPGFFVDVDAALPIVVAIWLTGVTAFLVRFARGYWRMHRLRIASIGAAISAWQPASERLARRLGLDVAFRVVDSTLVDVPAVVGWVRPIILLPVAVLANLTPAQVDALIVHELAHIRRRDFLVNLLQTLAESLFFFHPGVWWVSTRIRQEREHCCDDLVVRLSGEPVAYAEALVELASCRTRAAALSIAAADGSLLTRVRRLLRVPADDEPRVLSGVVALSLGVAVAAALFVLAPPSRADAGAVAANQAAQPNRLVEHTDHFEIHYPPDLDLHAQRVAREAERAYERVSGDLKHSLAFRVPVVLFRTTGEVNEAARSGRIGQLHAGSFADPSRDRIVLAVDRPVDQWLGLLTHEVAHIFGFDILPGTSTPRWIMEGLAEYQRGTWDPSALVVVRAAVRENAIPKMTGLRGDGGGASAAVIDALGHAAFDFIESRWGKPGMRQFLFALRQSIRGGGNPYESAFRMNPDEFDRAFETYLRERFSGAAGQSLGDRFDLRATRRIEGAIIAIQFPVAAGRACLELWVHETQRWGVECDGAAAQDLMPALKPGDRVIVTGPPAREAGAQRIIVRRLVRPADGFTWASQAG